MSEASAASGGGQRRAPLALVTGHTPERIADVRALFEEYAAWLGLHLCFQNFEEEVATLPGAYAPPGGELLLALDDQEVAGCVALRDHGDGICELKRLYVRPAWRGRGVGRMLTDRIVQRARAIGYREMRLDTLDNERMHAANRLYESLGFVDTAAYYDNPLPNVRYMALSL